MNRFLRIASCGLLIILTGCSAFQSYDSDWLNRLLSTPTAASVTLAPSSPQPAQATEPATEPPQPAVTEPMILRVWLPPQFNPNTNTTSSSLLKQRLANFEAEHPGLEIDVRIKSESGEADLLNSLSITSMAAPGALPDLIALPRSALESAAQKGLVRPLADLSKDLPATDFYPYARDLGKVQGTTFGVPFAGDGLVIMYRPELVWIKNWDSILLSESQLVFAGADSSAQVGLSMYVSAGGEILDPQGKPTLDQETLTRVLDIFAKGRAATLFPDAAINISTEEQVMQEYRARRADMAIAHYSQYRSTQDGLVQPLMGVDVEHLTFATGWVWALASQTSENRELSVELLQYLTADDFLRPWINETGYLPTRSSTLDETDSATIGPIIEAARLVPSNEVLQVLGPLMQEALVRVMNGEQPDAVARSVNDKLK
jgi:multiple sugar transport system substrate-binding protein